MKVSIGSDHAGFELKARVVYHLKSKGFEVMDFGTGSEASVDYPDFAHPTAEAVSSGECDFGILICGSANGMAITANKHRDIRCALCWQPDIAALAKQHNNANMIALPARFISDELALQIVDAYLHAEYEGGRHQRRVDKMPC